MFILISSVDVKEKLLALLEGYIWAKIKRKVERKYYGKVVDEYISSTGEKRHNFFQCLVL